MVNKTLVYLILLVPLFLFKGQGSLQPDLHVYINNTSFEDPSLLLEMELDGQLLVSQYFSADSNRDNYRMFKYAVPEQPVVMRLYEPEYGVALIDTIDFRSRPFIYIDYLKTSYPEHTVWMRPDSTISSTPSDQVLDCMTQQLWERKFVVHQTSKPLL